LREHAQRDLRREVLVGDRDLSQRPLLAHHEQRGRDQLDVDLRRGQATVHRLADDALGRIRIAHEQRVGEVPAEPEHRGSDHMTFLH
jgi:hypothetical protein